MTCNDTEKQTKLMSKYMITCDLKAEMNLRTPKTLRVGRKSMGKSTVVPRRAGRSGRAIVHAAGGQTLKKALRSHPQTTGTRFVAGNDTERRTKLKYHYMIACDWKAEREQALRAPHSKFR